MPNLLVVDDEQSICWGLERLGKSMGHAVAVAPSAEEGLRLAATAPPDVLILDVRLPGMDGLTAMNEFGRYIGSTPIIVITAFGDLGTAVQAVEQGAFEYVVKPFDLVEIRAAIERALCKVQEVTTAPVKTLEEMLGRTPAMQAVFKRIALAARSDVATLIYGESGVGKELAARAIHRHSDRAAETFVAVNVAALSPTLAEAELFGHVEGAFTGAGQSRKGLLVEADDGTLFLDEVAEIPLPLQVKLLRVLDQGEVLPLGADRPVETRFRVIAATHQNLLQKVRAGEFRHDLFYRLSAFEISLPPLRERTEDIRLLAAHFVSQLGAQQAVLADETLVELERRVWHGNVRELRNAVEHALVVARTGVVLPGHLPPSLPALQGHDPSQLEPVLTDAAKRCAQDLLGDPAATGVVYERYLQEVEPPLLASAMRRYKNECAPAARALGLHRTTLKKKLDQYGMGGRTGDS